MNPQISVGVDYGTSNTVAVLRIAGRPAQMLLFDGSPQLSSSIFADAASGLLTGRDALHAARTDPARFEPNPKRRIEEHTRQVLLGQAEYPLAELAGATLRRVRQEAERVAGGPIGDAVLTCPASWGARRRDILVRAAAIAGLPSPRLVPEPVAAAGYFVDVLGTRVPVGNCVVVYDFGAGTFDASVVRRTDDGFVVLATAGRSDTGGIDLDAAIVAEVITAAAGRDPTYRIRLQNPTNAEERRARATLWEDARSAKEMLSRAASTSITVPLAELDVPLGRERFEALVRPMLERTVETTRGAIRDADTTPEQITGVFLVGGSSRIPLASTLLHRALATAPTVLDRPELVVAEGAALLAGPGPQATRLPPRGARPKEQAGTVTPTLTLPGLPAPVGDARQPAPGQTPSAPHRPAPGQMPSTQRRAAPGRTPSDPYQPTSGRTPSDPYQPTSGQAPSAQRRPASGQVDSAPRRPSPGGRSGRRGPSLRPLGVIAVLVAVALLLGPVIWFRLGGNPFGADSAHGSGDPGASASSGAPRAFPGSVTGGWTGTMAQNNGARWKVTIELPAGESVGQISYASSTDGQCTGTLTLDSVSGPQAEAKVVTKEKITEGRCTKSGTTTLVLQNDRLMMGYQPDGAAYTASAVLERIRS